jgi:2-keto-3-deoxy-L-fuconate dehydrogenase
MGELTGLKALVTRGASGIAHAVLYLAFPRAGSTTGAEIAVDGGMAGVRLRPRT